MVTGGIFQPLDKKTHLHLVPVKQVAYSGICGLDEIFRHTKNKCPSLGKAIVQRMIIVLIGMADGKGELEVEFGSKKGLKKAECM